MMKGSLFSQSFLDEAAINGLGGGGGGTPNKFQTKFLPSDITTGAQFLTDISFSNLALGKFYMLIGSIRYESVRPCFIELEITNSSTVNSVGGQRIDQFYLERTTTGISVNLNGRYSVSSIFEATQPAIAIRAATQFGVTLKGFNSRQGTYLQLIELNNIVEVTDFT